MTSDDRPADARPASTTDPMLTSDEWDIVLDALLTEEGIARENARMWKGRSREDRYRREADEAVRIHDKLAAALAGRPAPLTDSEVDEFLDGCDANADPERTQRIRAIYQARLAARPAVPPLPQPHWCAGCRHRWEGPPSPVELCGDCWRRVQPTLHGAAPAVPSDTLYEQAIQERDAAKEENTVLHNTCGHYEEEILRLRTDLAALFAAKSEAQPPSAAPPEK